MVEPTPHPDLERLQSQLDAIGIAATTPPIAELAPAVQAPAFFRAVQARHTRRIALEYGGIAAAILVILGTLFLQRWIRQHLAPATPSPSHSMHDLDTTIPATRDTTDTITAAWPSVIRLTHANRDTDANALQLPSSPDQGPRDFDPQEVQTPRSAPGMLSAEP